MTINVHWICGKAVSSFTKGDDLSAFAIIIGMSKKFFGTICMGASLA